MLRLYDLTSKGELTPVTVTDPDATFLGVPQELILFVESNGTGVGIELYNLLHSAYGPFQLINIGELCADKTYEVEIVNSVDLTTLDVENDVKLTQTLQGVF